jgi:GT2 family glycosyltransferase
VGHALPVMATCTLVARREVFDEVGLFDVALRSSEDTDWIVRAIAAGVESAMVPRPLLRRRIHGANLSTEAPLDRRQLFGLLRAQIARRRREPAR